MEGCPFNRQRDVPDTPIIIPYSMKKNKTFFKTNSEYKQDSAQYLKQLFTRPICPMR